MPETLEREEELERVAAVLDAAAAGEGRALLIEGPAGIGKTRLVEDARALAKLRGFGRLRATGDELERAMPWSVVRQMVERSISRYSGEDRKALLAGPSGAALAALDDAPIEAPAGDAAVARTLHALWWVAADLASFRPLLITVDDAQWSDLPSLRFLVYLSRRIADLPIALVIGTRPPQEPSGPLAELTAAPTVGRLRPQPLSRDAVRELSEARGTAAPEVVGAVHEATGGNPFLTHVLLDELTARGFELHHPRTAERVSGLGPSTISRAMLARLTEDATALARAAAVLGGRADPWLAAQLAGLDHERSAAANDALAAANVMAAAGDQLAFVHPVVREAVLAELRPGERAELHARAARALRASGAPAGRVAVHLAAAPPGTLPGAAPLLRDSAAALLAEGDAVTACAQLARAHDEAPADEAIRADLGLALLRVGEPERAREHLLAAAAAAPTVRQRAERLAAAASATARLAGPEAAIDELRDTLGAWPQDAGPERLVLEARLAAMRSLVPSEYAPGAEHLRRFADVPGTTPEERSLLALLAQRARYEAQPAAEVAAIARRALGSGAYLDDIADSPDGMVAWIVAAMALITADATEAAREEIAHARVRVRERGSPLDFGIVSTAAACLAWRGGDVRAAEEEAAAALAAVTDADSHVPALGVRASATYFVVLAVLERGDRGAAERALAAFDAAPHSDGSLIPSLWIRNVRALAALAADEPERAYREATALGESLRAARIDTPTVPWRRQAALAALRLGRSAEAVALAREHLALARRWGAPTDLGAALRLVARVDPAARMDALEEAVAVLDGSAARLELALALVDLGEALRVVRRRRDAREQLRRGADLAVECGARGLQERATDALASLGDRPRELMFSGVEGLTASERRVAQLASGGRSNREIAQELFVTPKTVENHLGRVYVKLGITSRRELAGALE